MLVFKPALQYFEASYEATTNILNCQSISKQNEAKLMQVGVVGMAYCRLVLLLV